ncbi:MAG TPA: hypothetical protein VK686_07810 [Bryobacteraceae bacterium]|jgi:hypothetical protein|nr:hypothetical protein [Bryobacteraceae bacterium]
MLAVLRIPTVLALVAGFALAQTATKSWTPPKTSWGDPDLEGTWTSDDQYGVPFERPAKFGTRKTLTEQELADRVKEDELLQNSIEAGERPNAGYWKNQKGVDAAAVPANWLEFARHASRQTSLVVDPPDGRIPLTETGKELAAAAAARRGQAPGSWLDLTMYDRCITRGVPGSIFPVVYGNGTQFIQTKGLIAIRYEMIHETRLVPMDGRAHLPATLRSYMGDPIGHWEGNTLVVETTNFIGGHVGVGGNGNGPPYSEDLKLVERFTRTSDKTIQYEITITDPQTYTAPWTVAFPITREPGYQIFEYACHEGNYAMHNRLSAARADERRAAAKAAETK